MVLLAEVLEFGVGYEFVGCDSSRVRGEILMIKVGPNYGMAWIKPRNLEKN